jgi:hypothetical protein
MRRQHAHLLAGYGNWQLVGEFTDPNGPAVMSLVNGVPLILYYFYLELLCC